MSTKRKSSLTATPSTDSAKVAKEKDLCKVLEFFEYNFGTSLDCSKACHVLRNSVTWYISKLEDMNLLQAVCKRPDRETGYRSNYYSADRRLWKRSVPQELDLFRKEAFNG